jgi:hypothetical protein
MCGVIMKLIFLIFAIASSFLISNAGLAQTRRTVTSGQKNAAVVAEIKRLENELARAVVARDYRALQRIESDTIAERVLRENGLGLAEVRQRIESKGAKN